MGQNSNFKMLRCKIQTLQTSEDKVQSLKLYDVKSKYPQILGVQFTLIIIIIIIIIIWS